MGLEERKTSDGSRERELPYATADDFCNELNRNLDSLYSLAVLLTGDEKKAERCLLAAFTECLMAKGVFKKWMHSWVRIALVKHAARIVKPVASEARSAQLNAIDSLHPAGSPILKLGTFDRFVYVLSVLDWYSVRDCAALLRCTMQEVVAAKQRALKSVAEAAIQVMTPPERQMGQGVTA